MIQYCLQIGLGHHVPSQMQFLDMKSPSVSLESVNCRSLDIVVTNLYNALHKLYSLIRLHKKVCPGKQCARLTISLASLEEILCPIIEFCRAC